MTPDEFLAKLERVTRTGSDQYRAVCPAHGGHSLAVKILDDGRILLKCWAGCNTRAVLDAAGLAFADLFPEKLGDHIQRVRTPWGARDAIDLVLHEATVVALVAHDILQFREPSDDDWQRLVLASQRLDGVARAVRS